MIGKKLINTGGAAEAAFLPSQHFETVTYTGNGSTQSVGGFINRGAVFNGSSSSLDIESLDLIQNQIESFSFWFRGKFVFGFYDPSSASTSDRRRWFIDNTTTGSIKIQVNNDQYNYEQTGITEDSDWHHLAVVSDGKIYLDGTQLTNTFNTSYWITDGTNGTQRDTIRIGTSDFIGAANEGYSAGSYDQIRLFNKALSSDEVTTLYGETAASTSKSVTDIFDDNSGVALYQLDGNANDTGGVSGKFGSAAIFNGSSSVIESTSLNYAALPTNTAWAVSCWINNSDNTITSAPISLMGGINGWGLFLQSGTVQLATDGSTPTATTGAFATLANNTWMHVVLSYDGSGTTTLYYDGSFGATVSFTFSAITSGNLKIGKAPYWSYFKGKIDQIRIYDTALSSSDVTNLYNESSVPTTNLVAHYKFDGDARDEQQLYDGTATNVVYAYDGTATNVTYQEATKFQPDLVWIKERTTAEGHRLYDSIRGATKHLNSENTSAEATNTAGLASFDSNGFSVGSYAPVNTNAEDYVAWCWKAGGDDVLNEEGSIDSQVSANQDAGFSIVSYTGNGSAGATVGHGLSSAPEMVFFKNRTDTENWDGQIFGTIRMGLNSTEADQGNNLVTFGSTVMNLTTSNRNNGSGDNMIAYCFHSVDGYSKVGSYIGDGNESGNHIVTGFEPQFVIIKATENVSDWIIFDTERDSVNPTTKLLYANLSSAEQDGITDRSPDLYIEVTSNGFQIKGLNNDINVNGEKFIYLAIAADPDVTQPVVENSFDVVTYTGNGGTQSIDTDFKPDLVWIKCRDAARDNRLVDSVRGVGLALISDQTATEQSESTGLTSFDSNGFSLGSSGGYNNNTENFVAWCWKAGDHDDNLPQINTEGTIDSVVSVNAAAGFSIVKANSSSSNTDTVGHGLSSAPEMIIRKRLDGTSGWLVLVDINGTYYELFLNSSTAATSASSFATSTTIETRSGTSGNEYIWYCFHSVDSYQKVGSYTGTGATGNVINVGFKPRFILLKNTSSGTNGDGWFMFDTTRSGSDVIDVNLQAHISDAESGPYSYTITVSSTGFEPTGSFANFTGTNASGNTYIYLAIA